MVYALFFKDSLSRADICFGHMRDLSLMLLELKERHLYGWGGPPALRGVLFWRIN